MQISCIVPDIKLPRDTGLCAWLHGLEVVFFKGSEKRLKGEIEDCYKEEWETEEEVEEEQERENEREMGKEKNWVLKQINERQEKPH